MDILLWSEDGLIQTEMNKRVKCIFGNLYLSVVRWVASEESVSLGYMCDYFTLFSLCSSLGWPCSWNHVASHAQRRQQRGPTTQSCLASRQQKQEAKRVERSEPYPQGTRT